MVKVKEKSHKMLLPKQSASIQLLYEFQLTRKVISYSSIRQKLKTNWNFHGSR